MGVSGVGKTEIARRVAAAKGWTFVEGDDLHPAANREKMRQGMSLDDADRAPWLAAVVNEIRRILAAGGSAVVTCSALKRAYRDTLRSAGPEVRFVYLKADRPTVLQRLRARVGHYADERILEGQFAALEEPTPDERIAVIDASLPIDEVVSRVGTACGL